MAVQVSLNDMDVPSTPKAFVQGKAARFGGIEGNHVSANRQVFGYGSKDPLPTSSTRSPRYGAHKSATQRR